MQEEADAHRLGLELQDEPSPAIAAAHRAMMQFCGYSFEAATELFRGDANVAEQLAGEINAAAQDARHQGASGVRRAVSHVIEDHKRRAPVAVSAAAVTEDPPAAEVPPSQPMGDGTATE